MVRLEKYTMKFEDAIGIAKKAALKSDMRHKLGSILYDKSRYVTGWNISYGCKVDTKNTPFSLHAEEHTILKGVRVGIEFDKAILIVVRVNNKGDMRKSKPCFNCQRLIERVNMRQVYYIG